MNVALRRPVMTREEFLDWAGRQEERYEFNGTRPVAMTGGSVDHDTITNNIQGALRSRLNNTACRSMGPNVSVATIGTATRYPDALVTCTPVPGKARTIPGVIVVFEVVSPSSVHTDYIVKVREYRAVPSMLRYIILEQDSAGLTVLHRIGGDDEWTANTLIAGETLVMPEIGIETPVDEFYRGVNLPAATDTGSDSQPAA